jgi:mRNA interferase RelE/StbE
VHDIQFAPSAERELEKLPKPIQVRIGLALAGLAVDPRPSGVKKLKGQHYDRYRIRLGDFRVIYEVHDSELVVLVVKVGNRDDLYNRFRG